MRGIQLDLQAKHPKNEVSTTYYIRYLQIYYIKQSPQLAQLTTAKMIHPLVSKSTNHSSRETQQDMITFSSPIYDLQPFSKTQKDTSRRFVRWFWNSLIATTLGPHNDSSNSKQSIIEIISNEEISLFSAWNDVRLCALQCVHLWHSSTKTNGRSKQGRSWAVHSELLNKKIPAQ